MAKSSTEFIAMSADKETGKLEIVTRFLLADVPSSFLSASTIEVGNKCLVAKVGNIFYSFGTTIGLIKNFQQQQPNSLSDTL